MKKTVRNVDVTGKRVLVRVDFNVPLQDGIVMDDTRIKGALPTINYLIKSNSKIILASHLGRPKGKIIPEMSLEPVAKYLQTLVKVPVHFVRTTYGPEVEKRTNELKEGEILILENTRFDPGETKNDPTMATELAKLADIFVNDAFGTAHRAHCSTVGVAKLLPAVSGLLMEKEIKALSAATTNPVKPVLAIIGGAKISSKLEVLENFLEFVDILVIGGGMAFTFLQAQGINVGKSLVESDMVDTAKLILSTATAKNIKMILPVDVRIAATYDEPLLENDIAKIVSAHQIPSETMGLDIGTATEALITDAINTAATILWNGPLGVFEKPLYAKGTNAVAAAILNRNTTTVIGGGDSVYALNNLLKMKQLTLPEVSPIHVSTGGGASLEFLAGKILPGVAVLEDTN